MLLLTPVLQLKSQNVCWRSEPWSRVKGELETCYRWLYVCSLTDTGAFKRNRQYQQSGALYTVTDVQSWESGICTSFSSSPLIFHTTVSCLVFIWVQNLDFFDFFFRAQIVWKCALSALLTGIIGCDHSEQVQTHLLTSTPNPYDKRSFHATKTPNIGRCALHLSNSWNPQLAVVFVSDWLEDVHFLLFSCKTTDNLSFLFDWWKFRILLTVEHPVRTLGLWGLTVITFIYKASFRSQLERAQNTGWTVRSSGTFAEGSCFCEVNWYCLERTNGITFTTNTVCRPHAEKI